MLAFKGRKGICTLEVTLMIPNDKHTLNGFSTAQYHYIDLCL